MFWLFVYFTSLLLLWHKHWFSRYSAVLPVIARSPSVLSVVEDQPVTLPCVLLAGNPLPARQWLHNYGLVGARLRTFASLGGFGWPCLTFLFSQVTTDQYVKVRKDGSLHIERVRLDHVGDYTCLAENVVGLYNHTTTLNVYGSPNQKSISIS